MDAKHFIITMTMFAFCTAAFALLFTPNVYGVNQSSSHESAARALQVSSAVTNYSSPYSSPFVPLNKQCQQNCLGASTPTPSSSMLEPLTSSCPQSGPEYLNQHCNSCCDRGASSLSLRCVSRLPWRFAGLLVWASVAVFQLFLVTFFCINGILDIELMGLTCFLVVFANWVDLVPRRGPCVCMSSLERCTHYLSLYSFTQNPWLHWQYLLSSCRRGIKRLRHFSIQHVGGPLP
jgi:hypothetical protein